MAWYEYQQEARQVPTMYELSGRAAKDGRKVFWLLMGLFGAVIGVIGAIFDLIFGLSVGIIVIGGLALCILGLMVSGPSKGATPRGRWHQREIARRTVLGY